jgi:hypothetical protein
VHAETKKLKVGVWGEFFVIKIIGREYVHTYILGVEYYLYYDMYLEGKGK